MRFRSETERMAHPQAGLIPASLWYDIRLFNNELPDALLPLMQADDGDLHHLLGQSSGLITGRLSFYKCAWLAIATSHPNLSNETLVTLAGRLGLNRNDLFEAAIYWGKVNFFDYLSTQYEITVFQKMIAADNYQAFRNAARHGHLEMVNFLVKLAGDDAEVMIAAGSWWAKFKAFREAASRGDLRAVNLLVKLAGHHAPELIVADNYAAFRETASNGHLAVVKRLVKLSPGNAEAMIAACNYEAFRNAAQNGDLAVVNLLVKRLFAHVVQAMIAARDYEAFRKAACHGHLDMVNRLVVIHHDHLNAINRVINRLRGNYTWTMIISGNYAAFREAASHGHLAVVHRLVELSPSRRKIQTMIASDNYEAFRLAAGHGHLEVVNLLVALSPGDVQAMIAANNYAPFRLAAGHGHLAVVNRLVALSPDNVQAMISIAKYQAFWLAAGNGHLDMVNLLVKLSPDNIQAMIAAYDYSAFCLAACNGHLAVVNRLVALSPGNVQEMIAAHDYKAFRYAARNGHLHVVNCLLSFPSVLAYAEMHEREYRKQYVRLFINDKLALLSKEIALAKQENSSVEFDIADPEEAKLYFYVIRNLIRRNESALLDNIRLLLDIPAVRALAHRAITPGMPNELLRLAMSTGNWAAASRLLTIPAVYHLAKENNDYRDERQDSRDLAALARDCESSMPVLRVAEQLPEPKDTASNAGLASEAGFFANTSARQELERGVTNSPRVTL